MGASPGTVRAETERHIARGGGDGSGTRKRELTDGAKRSIDLSYEEARRVESNQIGTKQILLGLIGEHEGLAARVLGAQGVDLERARAEVDRLAAGGAGAA